MTKTRIEKDSLGDIEVPSDAYYGAQTERARRNFPVSGLTFPPRFLAALGSDQARGAPRSTPRWGSSSRALAEAIVQAANEVADQPARHGLSARHLPDRVGHFHQHERQRSDLESGDRAARRRERGSKKPVHPNDHVNAGQSSNDVIPTAIHVAAYAGLVESLEPALERLADALERKAREFDDVVKIGRTHLQDAVPIRWGRSSRATSGRCAAAWSGSRAVKPRLAELALGGTAVGTGFNAPPGFADAVIARLARSSGHPFVPARNRFEALAAKDAAVEVSGALKTIAVSLSKIANDIRWMGSGPRCGIGEIGLPSLQPGSSIMPGKVNPVIPEMVAMVAAQVIGNDATIAIGGMSGNFDLNVMMPVIAYNLLQSIEILANASRLLADRCVDGLTADRERTEALVEQSLAMVTSLAPLIGYDAAAAIAKESIATGKTVRQLCEEKAVLPPDQLRAALDARAQTEGGLHGGGGG